MRISGSRKKGFSLVEVLIALLVLSIGVLGVTGMFYYISRSITYGGKYSQALNYTREIIDNIRSQQRITFSGGSMSVSGGVINFYAPPNAGAVKVNASPFTSLFNGDAEAGNFYRVVSVNQLASSGYQSEIAVITVQVYWREKEWKNVELSAYYRQI